MFTICFLILASYSSFIQLTNMSVFRKLLRRRGRVESSPSDVRSRVLENATADGQSTSTSNQGNIITTPSDDSDDTQRQVSNAGPTSDSIAEGGPSPPNVTFALPTTQEADEEVKDKSTSTEGLDNTDTDIDDLLLAGKSESLCDRISKLRSERNRLKRRQTDAMHLENELRHVIGLLSLTRLQTEAVKTEIMAKKCELKFLATQVPEGYEQEAKKKEPVFYKKYNNIKSTNDAKALLLSIRQRMRVIQYLELLTFNKVLEHQHGLKREIVKKAFGQLMSKPHNFDHIADCFRPLNMNPETHTVVSELTDSDPPTPNSITTVTIESLPVSSSSPEVTSLIPASPPTAPPPLPFHGFGPFPPLQSTGGRPETFI